MKRILVYMNSFNVGGVTSVAKSIYRNLDRTKFQMDFIRREGPENGFDREIKDKGDRVFCFRDMPLSKIPIINYLHRSSRIIAQLEKLLGKERYDVIHIHAHPSIALLYAKRAGIPQIIMHAHEAVPDFGDNVQKSMAMNMLWKYRQHLYKTIPTVKAGDSLKACVVKYGEEVKKDPRLTVLHPSIDPSRFDKRLYDKESIIKQFRINTNAVMIPLISIIKDHIHSFQTAPFTADWVSLISAAKRHEVSAILYAQCKDFIPEPFANVR